MLAKHVVPIIRKMDLSSLVMIENERMNKVKEGEFGL